MTQSPRLVRWEKFRNFASVMRKSLAIVIAALFLAFSFGAVTSDAQTPAARRLSSQLAQDGPQSRMPSVDDAPKATAKSNMPSGATSRAWTLLEPLGVHEPSTLDTLLYNYAQHSVPSEQSIAYATTGNLGAAGMDMIYFDRLPRSDFFFRDALRAWLPMQGNHKFYNTRVPMTLLSYNTGGNRENAQDRLTAVFSGNAGARLQFGANIDYIYSKGSYDHQAVKNLIWGLASSYMGDRYEYQAFFNHYNGLNQDNGGITNDLYITDPAELQGGQASIEPKSIPTNLTQARTRLKGQEFYMNHRYKIGFWKDLPRDEENPDDTLQRRVYVPVTSIVWTFDYNDAKHVFFNGSPSEADEFWNNRYLTAGPSMDPTSYWSLSNTVGIALLEGFNKYAKAGLSAYVSHEIRRFTQGPDTIPMSGPDRPEALSPYPYDVQVARKGTENLLWVGAQLTKQQGRLLHYDATARIGVAGESAGELQLQGNISARFPLFGDSAAVSAYGFFSNEDAPYLMRNYVSNHFIWKNDFGMTRRFRVGGRIHLGRTGTIVNVGVENVQNSVYFNDLSLPTQHGGSVQVLSASLSQDFRFGILNWNNRVTFQTTSDDAVVPLPRLAIYSNLFLKFRVAKVLHVQFGIDCDYFTKYYAPGYQPATMAFINQREVKVGNYPFMNLYANMKLKRARFYIMMSHVNQGLTGDNYFSMPHYPVNPRRFQMGVSVDFAN